MQFNYKESCLIWSSRLTIENTNERTEWIGSLSQLDGFCWHWNYREWYIVIRNVHFAVELSKAYWSSDSSEIIPNSNRVVFRSIGPLIYKDVGRRAKTDAGTRLTRRSDAPTEWTSCINELTDQTWPTQGRVKGRLKRIFRGIRKRRRRPKTRRKRQRRGRCYCCLISFKFTIHYHLFSRSCIRFHLLLVIRRRI